MPKVTGIYEHSLDNLEVRSKMKLALEDLLKAFEMKDIAVIEDDDKFQFSGNSRGVDTKGTIDINETDVQVSIELPFSAIAFKGRVQKALDTRVPPFLG